MEALQIHPEKCTGCKQCELACSWVQTGTFQPSRSVVRVHVFDEQASFAPYACLQCDEAWCMQACPVNAIDAALRQAVETALPQLADIHLTDFKVRILDGGSATGATTRVLLSATNGETDWTTIGVSPNIIEASWWALEESLVYGLLHAPSS